MHVCPQFKKRAFTAVFMAVSSEASSKMIYGSDPPSSNTHGFK